MDLNKNQNAIFESIISHVDNGAVIFGEQQTGKTIVMNHLKEYFKKERCFRFIVFFSVHEFIDGDERRTYNRILSFICKEFGVRDDYGELSSFVRKNSRKFIFMIDEYQDLPEPLSLNFRAWGQARHIVRIVASNDIRKNSYGTNDLAYYKLKKDLEINKE